MEVILLLGPPGSGKGTLAQQLTQRNPNLRHVSTGDLLREAVAQNTPAGLQAAPIMKRGELVPDPLIAEMLRDYLMGARVSNPRDGECKSGGLQIRPPPTFLLDGFPRNLAQATLLDALLSDCSIPLRAAILLDVPERILLSRITGRRVCPTCKNIHHITTRPPKNENHCDTCGSPLIQRPDDSPSTVLRRLSVYNDATSSLITLYASRNLLKKVNADAPPPEIAENILRLMAHG